MLTPSWAQFYMWLAVQHGEQPLQRVLTHEVRKGDTGRATGPSCQRPAGGYLLQLGIHLGQLLCCQAIHGLGLPVPLLLHGSSGIGCTQAQLHWQKPIIVAPPALGLIITR